jgi:hypothetical protein
MSILPFPVERIKRPCDGCSILFRPAQSTHRLCRICYRAARWAAAFKAQEALWRDLIRGIDA